MALPTLDFLAYPPDGMDHPGGGHCVWLGGDEPAEDRVAMVEQYLTAVNVLVKAAQATGSGWSLTRPILFAVHQLCEISLDHAVHRGSTKAKKDARHSLADRFEAATQGGAYQHLDKADMEWCERFVREITPITRDGFPGRYANNRWNGTELDDVYCCVNVDAVRDAAVSFALLTVPELERVVAHDFEHDIDVVTGTQPDLEAP